MACTDDTRRSDIPEKAQDLAVDLLITDMGNR